MSGPRQVLVVEDDLDNARLMGSWLSTVGFAVRHAITGEAALAECGRDRPDVVVLDIVLPGIDGIEVLRRLRRASGWEQLPVVVTSIVQVTDVEPELDRQVRSWLIKPFSARELQRAVAHALEAHDPPSGWDDADAARPRRVQDTGQGLA